MSLENQPDSPLPHAGWLRLWPVAMLPLIASAATRGFWAPDEPRYGEIAREIFRSGSVLVLHLCGDLYPDKPPLLFWLAGVFGSLTDWSEFAMRVPSLLTMAGTAWLTQRFALAWWSRREAIWAPILFLATVQATWLGGRLQIDPLLVFFCTAALFAATDGGRGSPLTMGRAVVTGLCLGIGGLAKGPVAWSNVGLVILVWHLLRGRLGTERRPFVRALPGLAVVAILAAGPAVAWALTAIAEEPSLKPHYLFHQHLSRVTHARNHAGPFWQPTQDMLMNAMPWTLPAIAMLGIVIHRWRAASVDAGAWRAGTWLLTILVFFSLIATKRELYLMPALPTVGLLAARWIVLQQGAARPERGWRAVALPSTILLAVVGLGGCVAFLFESSFPVGTPEIDGLVGRGLVFGVPTLVLGLLALRAAWRYRPAAWAGYQTGAWVTMGTLGALMVFPALDEVKCARSLGAILAARPECPETIPCFGVSPEAFRFYSGRPTVKVGGKEGRKIVDRAYRTEGQEFLALISRKRHKDLTKRVRAGLVVLHEQRLGRRTVRLIGRDPSPSGPSRSSPPWAR